MKLMLSSAAALGLMVASASAAVTFYDDKAAFDAATAGIAFTTDDFSTDIAQGQSITLSSGVTSTNVGGVAVAFDDNSVSGGKYQNATDGNGLSASFTIDWIFPSLVTAVGFDVTKIDPFLTAIVDGETADLADGFFGFVSTTALDGFTFGNNTTDTTDIFDLDNLQFGAGQVSAVPLPAALPLLLAGLGGLGIASRRRKS